MGRLRGRVESPKVIGRADGVSVWWSNFFCGGCLIAEWGRDGVVHHTGWLSADGVGLLGVFEDPV